MRRVALIVLLSACGRRSFDEVDAARPDSVPQGFCATAQFANPAASSLQDDFTTPYTARWRPNPQPCFNQVGTELVATPSNTMGEYCFATTLGDVHLTCDSVYVRVPEVTSPVLRVQTFIYVTSLIDGIAFQLLLESGGFGMGTPGVPSSAATAPYDPMNDVWWRLTEHDGELSFETSADFANWRELMRSPTVISLDHVGISVGAGTYSATIPPSPGQARFRCYNTPPPCN